MSGTRRAIAMFAKLPRHGHAKTRLAAAVGADAATALAGAFIADSAAVLTRAAAANEAEPFVFFDPPEAGGAMRALVGVIPTLVPQCAGDLTDRLTAAYDTLAAAGRPTVCFVGADSPTLPVGRVTEAFAALAGGAEVVLGPAADGGYYLIGLRAAQPGVFRAVDWSTDRVYAQTCARAAALGLALTALPPWYDVDDAPSLARLRRELLGPRGDAEQGEAAPRTRAVLVRLAADGC